MLSFRLDEMHRQRDSIAAALSLRLEIIAHPCQAELEWCLCIVSVDSKRETNRQR